jgi:hypothetical protein
MAKKKYGKYIKKLSFKDEGPGYYRQITKVNGNSAGVNVQIEYGTYIAAGKVGKEPYGSHVHDFDQVLLWLGTDMNDLSELGAEVEICLGEGKEKERHIFTCTSAVAVPRGLPHLPATHNRIDKPFIFMAVSCTLKYECTKLPSKKGVSESSSISGWMSKYRSHILHVPFIRKGAWHYGPLNRDDAGGTISEIDFKDFGFKFNMSHESIKKAPYRFGPIPDKPHVHNYHEFLCFLGADTNDLSYLGAEIEVCLGKEQEKHLINTPTVAVMPKGFPHCPVTITKVEKPFIFSVIRPFGAGKTTF